MYTLPPHPHYHQALGGGTTPLVASSSDWLSGGASRNFMRFVAMTALTAPRHFRRALNLLVLDVVGVLVVVVVYGVVCVLCLRCVFWGKLW